jgi:hypothetical protein
MAPRTTRRRRRQPGTAASNGVATTLLSQVNELVAENRSLTRENKELHSILERVTQAVKGVTPHPATGGRGATQGPGARATRVRRTRRKITDPATLERRRAALAKARAVLADRRAAKKSG